jgi:hypothetical protein
MKMFRSILCALILVILVSGCQGVKPTAQPVNPLLPSAGTDSMKGYELYSWQEDGQWYFSVLVGTNREKTLEEIQSPDARLKGIDGLQPVLKLLPAGAYLTWLSRESLAFPPQEMQDRVKEMCEEQGVELAIAK